MFIIFGLDKNPCQKYQTSMRSILETMNKTLGFLPFFYLNFEAFKIPQFKFGNLDMIHQCSMMQLIQAIIQGYDNLSLCFSVFHNHPCYTHLLRGTCVNHDLLEYSTCFTYIFSATQFFSSASLIPFQSTTVVLF